MFGYLPTIGLVIYWTIALTIVAAGLGGEQVVVTYRDICSGMGT